MMQNAFTRWALEGDLKGTRRALKGDLGTHGAQTHESRKHSKGNWTLWWSKDAWTLRHSRYFDTVEIKAHEALYLAESKKFKLHEWLLVQSLG